MTNGDFPSFIVSFPMKNGDVPSFVWFTYLPGRVFPSRFFVHRVKSTNATKLPAGFVDAGGGSCVTCRLLRESCKGLVTWDY